VDGTQWAGARCRRDMDDNERTAVLIQRNRALLALAVPRAPQRARQCWRRDAVSTWSNEIEPSGNAGGRPFIARRMRERPTRTMNGMAPEIR
jgi:hypothetical protein